MSGHRYARPGRAAGIPGEIRLNTPSRMTAVAEWAVMQQRGQGLPQRCRAWAAMTAAHADSGTPSFRFLGRGRSRRRSLTPSARPPPPSSACR
jgi:hypothetical protein